MRRNASPGHGWWRTARRQRPALVVGVVLVAVLTPAAAGVFRSHGGSSLVRATAGPGRATQGGEVPVPQPTAVMAQKGNLPKPIVHAKPTELRLTKAHGPVFDVRKLHGAVVKQERPERAAPGETEQPAATEADPNGGLPSTISPSSIAPQNAPAPAPTQSFEGLDFANWGAGHPPDTNGDVGPTYYIETINTSIGIYDKSNGTRVAAFTFDSFMSQGHFGNLCDTNNFGDPVVLYDSFEDRWFLSDFAFKLDTSGNVSPETVFECFAVSKTGDPVSGGWNFYSILAPGGLADYPKFGVWPDGIYMSANMFGYAAKAPFTSPRVWAINKQQMYSGDPSVQVIDFAAPADDFTLLPANARLQAGTPPPGTPEYFTSTWDFLNGLTVYKLHADWDKISTSTFTGPDIPTNATSWPNAAVPNAATPGNTLDTLQIRAMAEAQYSNISGTESLWVAHTVRRANTAGFAAPRWYQVNVTGGTVAANTVQGTTWDPDASNLFYRFMPALAVDRLGDMALGYSKSNSTTNPQIKYAGRLAGDPVNTFSQTEQTLIDGTGTQTGNCGGASCVRWGDYSGMALDPNGCTFWITNEYYAVSGLNDLTRIGSFDFPGCTTVGNGTLSGTVTDGSNPISDATIHLGARTATTDATGSYTFTVPAGTYASLSASKAGFDSASASNIAVPSGGSTTRNFTLNASAISGCFTDNTQDAFQRGIPSACDLTASPGNVRLADQTPIDQKNETLGTSGVGITTTTWGGQTFTPSVSGPLTQVDVNLFCSGCTGTTPDLTLSLRATSGGLPTGADLVSATVSGFSSGASGFHTATFASPLNVSAGTQYALVIRPTANPSPGTNALTRSGTATAGSDVYAGGRRVAGATSGTVWSAPLTGGVSTDAGFRIHVHTGFASGTFISSLKDANPPAGRAATWKTLSFTASTPAGTDVKFQVAASNSSFGATNFVGPDGTAATFFTASGASLSQFDGFRYLRYKAYLSTTDSAVTPSLSSVAVCFIDVGSATDVSVAPASGTYGSTADLSATLTTGGNGVGGQSLDFTLNGNFVGSATTDANGVATLAGVSLAGIGAGSYPTAVGASFDGGVILDASNGTGSLTVAKANQTIAVTAHAPATAAYATSFTVAATGGGSGNAVTFSSGGVCTNVGALFTMTSGTGTCSVRYDEAGDANYNAAAQVVETVDAQKADQAIAVGDHAPATAVYATSFTVAATGGGSGNAVTFSSGGVCTNAGATFTMTSGTGTCSVRYDEAGDDNYLAATQIVESVSAQKAGQTLTVTTHAPSAAAYNASFGVAANAPGGVVSFSSSGVCSNSGSTFTITSGAGICSVVYDQAGDDNYLAAPQVVETVDAQKADQAIGVATHAPSSAVYAMSFTVAAIGGASGNAVTFSSDGVCTNVGATFTMTSGTGTCSVRYDEAGDANYNAAPQVVETVDAQKAGQAIAVTTHASSSAVYATSFTVAATGGGSGKPVTFSSAGVCTNVGATFTMTSGTGTCTVRYDQAGDDNYQAATRVVESVGAQRASQAIGVTTHVPSSAVYNGSFTVAANAPGGAVNFSSSGACSNSGGTFTMTSGTGTCSVKYDQAGDDNYSAAAQVVETVDAQKAGQAISVTAHPASSAVYATSFTVAATGGGSGNAVTFSSAGVCTNVGGTFTMTSGTGTCSVEYDQAGDDNYQAAPQVTESVVAQKAGQTITVTTHAPSSAVYNGSFTIAANAPGGVVSFSSSGVCSRSGNTLTMTSGAGTCSVKYDQAGNDNYQAAAQVVETVTAQKAGQTVSFNAPPNKTYGDPDFAPNASASSGLTVGYSASGACSIAGANVHLTGAGSCTVTASQGGDANYTGAASVARAFSIAAKGLTIRADDLTKLVDQTVSLGTTAFTASGLVRGDGIASVTLTSAGAAAEPAVGTYPIVPSAAVAAAGTTLGNYTITYANGTLTVTPLSGATGRWSVSIFGKGAVIDSIDSSVGRSRRVSAVNAGQLSSNGPITLEGAKVRSDVLSTHGSVTLRKASRVTGNVTAGGAIRNGGAISGTIKANSPSPTITASPVAPCTPFSGRAGIHGRFTYRPAKGDLTLTPGKTVRLDAGAYCFHSVRIPKRSVLKVTGQVTMTLTGVLRAPGTFVNTTSSPANLRIRSSYKDAKGVALAGGRKAYLTVYAPTTGITLSRGGAISGALFGRKLFVSGNSDVHFDTN